MKAKLFMTMAAATMILAGCSNDENEITDNWNGEIRLSSGVTVQQTRANNAGVPDTQIAADEFVKVVVTQQSGDSHNYAGYTLDFKADGNGGLSSATPMYYPTSGMGVNIYAYHPADAATSFSVQENQSVDKDYYKSDLLYSKAKDYARQKAAHSLTFDHKLCKVTYTLKSGTGSPDLTGATVKWLNVAKTIGFDAATGEVTTPTDTVTITPHATHGAIIVPQTVSSGTKLLQVTLANGGVLYYTPSTDQVFEGGKKYNYDITVNLSGLTVESTITDWTPVGKTGDAEME
ncbi:fimbrillin family protein [Phocaeicola sartorii]|uniref:fimbrillin family protein n=1 Tax=Phocaeicola sartorii TaxID=671267 RepID=UPI00258E0355|nr:fimbrillin family protein [Phocaeicola sartorii]